MCIRDRAYLGIKGGDVSSEMVAYGFPQGVYVSSVSAGSGAAKDVYKRQVYALLVQSLRLNSISELKECLLKIHRLSSVSYTHLDVYKRQMTGFWILWKEKRLFFIRQTMCRGQSDV